MFAVLSIDGGGIRGIIPALILAELERRSGKPTCELFQLLAGTSTGGILALALARPDDDGRPAFTAQDLVALYEEDGPDIFSRPIWHRVWALGNILEEKYPSAGIERALEDRFGDTRVADAITPVLVTAYDIEQRRPFFFKSNDATNDPSKNYLMRDAAHATSAAPTYFEPARIAASDEYEPICLVDGGVFSNNPAACALVEALSDFQAPPSEIAVLSLGTGELTRPIPFEDAKDWGLAMWAQPILSVVFDGVSDTVSYQIDKVIKAFSGPDRYLRMQTELVVGNDDMDDASRTNIEALKGVAERMIDRHSDELDAWAEMLSAHSHG